MRDLKADLELCAAAVPGPWFAYRTTSGTVTVQCPPGWVCVMSDKGDMATAKCIAEAREAWPEAIRRAIAAEQGMIELHARLVADELEGLDFLWQEYVQADPATLTQDARELAERVRQRVYEITGIGDLLEAARAALQAFECAICECCFDNYRDFGYPCPEDCTVSRAVSKLRASIAKTEGRDAGERNAD